MKLETLANGITVVTEKVEGVMTVAYNVIIPGGIMCDPEDAQGASLILAEITSRAAANLNSKDLIEQFESLGARHGESSSLERYSYSGIALQDDYQAALALHSKMILNPTLPEEEIDPIRSVLLQDLASLPESPSRRVMIEASKNFFPIPYNRCGIGTEEGIKNVTRPVLETLWKNCYQPSRVIISLAGALEEDAALHCATDLFGSWQGKGSDEVPFTEFQPRGYKHIEQQTEQLQMTFAFPSVSCTHELYYAARLAAAILSGGMHGRLFVEVREKRGLCYSVSASHRASKNYGLFSAYAGTTTARAHETMTVMLEQFEALKHGVTEEELTRAKTTIKSNLMMDEESTSSRAGGNAGDLISFGRLRSLSEILKNIDSVTTVDIQKLFSLYPATTHTLVTLGSEALTNIPQL